MQVRFIVVTLDVRHIHRIRNTGYLKDVARETPYIRIINNALHVALEMGGINRIKAHQCGKQPYIGLGKALSSEISRIGKNRLHAIQRSEQLIESPTISRLFFGKPAAIHAIVDAWVDLAIELVDFFMFIGWVKV